MSNRSYQYMVIKGSEKAQPLITKRCVEAKVQCHKKPDNPLAVFFIVLLFMMSSLATASDPAFAFNIPQQRADGALTALADQADISVVFDYDAISQHQANELKGRYKIREAVALLLADTLLNYEFDNSGHLIVTQFKVSDGDLEMGIKSKKKLLAATIAFFVGGVTENSVMAQGDDQGSREKFMLEEVIVTAEKRSESMQDVPIAITAFTGDGLEKSGINNSLDLEMVTPGLNYSTGTGIVRASIRGVGSYQLQGPGMDPGVSFYIDGVYQSRFTAAALELMDLERVEVLKGPQGILYGRNSTAGAVKFVSKDPDNELGGKISVQYGNYNLNNLKAQLNIPIVDDSLLFKASVMRQTRDGYSEDILTGFELDYDDLWAGRFTMKYMPTDTLDIVVHGSAVNDDGDFGAIKHFVDPGSANFGSALQISDPRKVAMDFGPREARTRVRSIDMTVNWDLDWAQFTSITGYTKNEEGPWKEDLDGTEIAAIHQGHPNADGLSFDTTTISQEFVLASKGDGDLDWTVGAYYLDDNPTWFTGIHLPLFSVPFGQYDASNQVDAYAVFAHASYALTEKLNLTLGSRYSYEEKEITVTYYEDFSLNRGPETRSKDWDDVSSKIGLDYSISDDVMIYGSYSEGFKSGGFQASSFDVGVDPEFITAYEVGMKSVWVDNRLRLNISAFQYDYEDLQVETIVLADNGDILNILDNAAVADIKGAEIALTAIPIESLTVDLGVSILDAKYDEFITPAGDVSGNRIQQSPEFTAALGVEYVRMMSDIGGEVSARLDYFYSERKYFNQFEDDLSSQPSYELINAQLRYTSPEETWYASIWGRNLTDELVVTKATTAPFLGENGVLHDLAPPRTYGLEVGYSF